MTPKQRKALRRSILDLQARIIMYNKKRAECNLTGYSAQVMETVIADMTRVLRAKEAAYKLHE